MKSLGITKIGQRKKLAKEISKSSSAERVSGSNSNSNTRSTKSSTCRRTSTANSPPDPRSLFLRPLAAVTDKDDDGSEDSGSKDSSNNAAQCTLKLVYGKDIRAIRVPMDIRYSELRHMVKDQFGQRMRMKYKGTRATRPTVCLLGFSDCWQKMMTVIMCPSVVNRT